ncbi:chemotaxis protein [Ancylothrix sp. C2]|uniref:chemotaxis protein n=1 Tax=Ancylothrix sp. D3o TaxID=2953691 RepID=UPI0021BAD9AF|nr:chemotaxis protein [Ancylothrix sp. D3o]MCT7948601.1 chemotaxis protein [Ancylothrix sp. D3o]
MIDLSQLTPDSTIGNLPSHHFQVSQRIPGNIVAKTFAHQPEIPGVMVLNGPRLVGMISRRKFYEWMSQPYNIELYMQRPIGAILDFFKIPALLLSQNSKIDEAAKIALNRSEDLVYEPVVIVYDDNSFRLLDMRVLLLGQSQMLSLSYEVIRLQKLEIHNSLNLIQKEQNKAKGYTQLLEFNLVELQNQNQLLSEQQSRLMKQAKRISQLNQKFIQIGKLLSLEGRKAFQATFAGVNAICQNTDQIVDIGKALAKELETINAASVLIAKVSQQVRYLAMQAAVVAHRSGDHFSEFSNVTSEIGKLVSQTFEAGRQVDQLANRFKIRVQDLTESAREGATVARSLIQQIETAEMALAQLEELVKYPASNMSSELHNPEINAYLETESLLQKIEQAEGALTELEQLVKHQDLVRVIEKIEGILSRQNRQIEKPGFSENLSL